MNKQVIKREFGPISTANCCRNEFKTDSDRISVLYLGFFIPPKCPKTNPMEFNESPKMHDCRIKKKHQNTHTQS